MSGPGLSLRLYRTLSPLLLGILRRSGRVSAKLREGLEGRRGLMERLLAEGPQVQNCIWFHATSVGEYEQARPMIRLLREAGIGPVCVTHFSPSGLNYARENPEGDLHDYLPLDHPGDMRALMRIWRPRALIFIKYDCWPNLVIAAHEQSVPVFLFSAALPKKSKRLSRPARPFFRSLFDLFTHIGAGNTADRDRFRKDLGVSCATSASGDTRAEQVIERYRDSAHSPLTTQLRAWGGRRLILGSTWPPDESVWWPILPTLLREFPDLKIVLVPHEPTPRRIGELSDRLSAAGIRTERLSDLPPETAIASEVSCLLVDRIGVLAGIYHAGSVAYVGGSFTTGVHSTLEPAIGRMPVLFGPRIANAEEALLMVRERAGRIVHDPHEALEAAGEWLRDEAARQKAGDSARHIVLAQRGAAERSIGILLDHIVSGSQTA